VQANGGLNGVDAVLNLLLVVIHGKIHRDGDGRPPDDLQQLVFEIRPQSERPVLYLPGIKMRHGCVPNAVCRARLLQDGRLSRPFQSDVLPIRAIAVLVEQFFQ
jgi:hypothetical protein